MHNMIMEHEGRSICMYDTNDIANPIQEFIPRTTNFLERVIEIHNSETTEDIAEHLYQNSKNGE